jgi:hypothetical protein
MLMLPRKFRSPRYALMVQNGNLAGHSPLPFTAFSADLVEDRRANVEQNHSA